MRPNTHSKRHVWGFQWISVKWFPTSALGLELFVTCGLCTQNLHFHFHVVCCFFFFIWLYFFPKMLLAEMNWATVKTYFVLKDYLLNKCVNSITNLNIKLLCTIISTVKCLLTVVISSCVIPDWGKKSHLYQSCLVQTFFFLTVAFAVDKMDFNTRWTLDVYINIILY